MTEQEFEAMLDEVGQMMAAGQQPSMAPDQRMNFAPGMQSQPQQIEPRHFAGLDPMTAGQTETSRRTIADARFRQSPAAQTMVEMTGIPSIYRGNVNAYQGAAEGNPAQVVKGVGQAAMGVTPYAGLGLRTFGAGLLGASVDDTMPQAQAAGREMPPLPARHRVTPMRLRRAFRRLKHRNHLRGKRHSGSLPTMRNKRAKQSEVRLEDCIARLLEDLAGNPAL